MNTMARRLYEQLSADGCTPCLGVFDGFSARLAARAGATILHASGGAISRAIGHPDIGLVTMTEMLGRIEEIVEASGVPVIADADTGYGNEQNAARAAHLFAKIGVAALHVEDQVFPKRCGHMQGVELIDTDEMVKKIQAMKSAVDGRALLIVRTDAVNVEGMDQALARTRAYLDAGGDIAFVEGLDTRAQIEQVAGHLQAPLMINQARASEGAVELLDRLAELGYRLALYPGDLQRAAAKSMQDAAAIILQSGNSADYASRMLSNTERDALF